MTSKPESRKPWRSRRLWIWSAIGVVWCAVVLVLALPAWRQTVDRAAQVQTVQRDLAALDQWSVAGLWLEKTVAVREPIVNKAWLDLFPPDRRREELFLDLARVADNSGVTQFGLQEVKVTDADKAYDSGFSQWDDEVSDTHSGAEMDFSAELPDVSPSAYRVKARFNGDYRKVASFLNGLQEIKRAVSIQNLIVRPSGNGVAVDLELDVYVSESS